MTSVERLKDLCRFYLKPVQYEACIQVLNDPAFATAPGGSTHHHAFVGGLADHTLEVAEFAMKFASGFEQRELALIAAVFHDYGKTLEYTIVDGKVESTPFRKHVGHVVWSWDFFNRVADFSNMKNEDIEAVGHALLAHHGRRDWGSPAEPLTPLAWALHSADMLSSRGYGK